MTLVVGAGYERSSSASHHLVVEAGQPVVGVVERLHQRQVGAAVEAVEVVRGRRTPRSRGTCGRPARPPSPRSRGCAGTCGRRARRYGAPEADVDVGLAAVQRVAGPRPVSPALARSRSGHSHTGRIPTSRSNQSRNSAGRSTGTSTSWTTRSRCGPGAPVEPVADAEAAVEADQPPVDVGAAEPARPHPADQRVLRAEGPRAPEPVGVPAPQVVVMVSRSSSRCWRSGRRPAGRCSRCVGPRARRSSAPASGRARPARRRPRRARRPARRPTRRSATIRVDGLASGVASSKRTCRSATYGCTGSSSILRRRA